MLSRQSWPSGLKVIFRLAVLALVTGIGQTLYWHFVTHEFIPQLTPQGAYAVLALLLGVACVAFGALGCPSAFASSALGTAVLHITVAAFFNLDLLTQWLPEILAGGFQELFSRDANNWFWIWNSMGIAHNVCICYYLLRYEFKIFGYKSPDP